MFIMLLAATFGVALSVSWMVARTFDAPIDGVLRRIIADDISQAWKKYLKFAVYVVGVSSGVRVWELERYITKEYSTAEILQLTWERWVLEVYRSVVGTLQGVAWALFAFFVFALLAYVIVRVFELRTAKSATANGG